MEPTIISFPGGTDSEIHDKRSCFFYLYVPFDWIYHNLIQNKIKYEKHSRAGV